MAESAAGSGRGGTKRGQRGAVSVRRAATSRQPPISAPVVMWMHCAETHSRFGKPSRFAVRMYPKGVHVCSAGTSVMHMSFVHTSWVNRGCAHMGGMAGTGGHAAARHWCRSQTRCVHDHRFPMRCVHDHRSPMRSSYACWDNFCGER